MKRMFQSAPNCGECGRFVSWHKNVSYVPYGSSSDLEPPDPEYFHVECYEALDENRKSTIQAISWMGPCREQGFKS